MGTGQPGSFAVDEVTRSMRTSMGKARRPPYDHRHPALMDENDEVLQEFLVESYENLDRLDQDLVALERGGPAPAVAEPDVPLLGELLVTTAGVAREDVAHAVELQQAGDTRPLGELLIDEGKLRPGELVDALQAQAEARSGVAEQSI